MVEEPTIEQSIEILNGLKDHYEAHHRVHFTDAAIEAAVELSNRYVQDRFLPDKAIDLIDEAGARMRISNMSVPEDVAKVSDKLKLRAQKEEEVRHQNFEAAAHLRDKEKELIRERAELEEKWREEAALNVATVDTRLPTSCRSRPAFPSRAWQGRDRAPAAYGRCPARACHPGRTRR